MAKLEEEKGCIVQVEYKTNSEDVLAGMKLLEKADTKNKRVVVLAAWIVFALCMYPVSVWLAAVFGCVALYTLLTRWVKPAANRKKLAEQIDAKNQTYVLKLYEKGLSITEGSEVHRLFYKDICRMEDERSFLLLHRQYALIVLPKRYMKEQLDTVAELFESKIEKYRHPTADKAAEK